MSDYLLLFVDDVYRSFSFYQYRGDETNIERVKQLSTLSMTINGEFAPPFNFKKAAIIPTSSSELGLKVTLECELDTLDQNKKCKGRCCF